MSKRSGRLGLMVGGAGLALLGLGGATTPPPPLPVAPAAVADAASPHDLDLLRQAFREAGRGNWSGAEAIAAQASDKLGLKVLRWFDLERPFGGHSFVEIADFVDANPDWPHQSTLRARAEESLAGAPEARVRDWFAHHKPVTTFGRLRAAEVTDDKAAAARLVRDTWINWDFAPADEKIALARYGDILTPEDHARRLDRLLWQGKAADAERMLPRVEGVAHTIGEARVRLLSGAKTADAVLASLPPVLQTDPGIEFDRARWDQRHDRWEAAAEILARVGGVGMPHPERWAGERQLAARHWLQAGDPARAYKVIADPGLTEGGDFAEAEFTAGWIALRFMKDPAKAYPHFVALYNGGKLPLTLSRGAYWAGRAAEATGQAALARGWYDKAAIYTATYYGQLAAAVPGVTPPAKPVPEPKASPAEFAQFQNKELVRAARLMAALGEEERVKAFMTRLSDLAQSPADHALVADLAESMGRPDLGVSAAKQATYAGVSLLRAGYPVIPMPRNGGAEQALLLALTRQESAFDVRALSPSGARGLMQLMPGTARDIARQITVPYDERRLTRDGAYNIELGQAFFDSLLATFNGSYVLAIAAYNAGPGAVQHWLQINGDPRSPDVDAVDWVELIPYNETRNYVQRVLENLQVYRLRIGNPSLAFSLEADLRR